MAEMAKATSNSSSEVQVGPEKLPGIFNNPGRTSAFVIFAHGSGSSRHSVRNRRVAEALNQVGMATLLFDLLRPQEELAENRAKVFDIPLLAGRLMGAVEWADRTVSAEIPVGFFGASTGAAAALVAAARLPERISAVVSRGGRPDLAGPALEKVRAPTLLIVGGADHIVLELNRLAQARLKGLSSLEIVPGATHLFPEPGAMERVMLLAGQWFERYLTSSPV
jgi:pimeloyl-ACP methyl ester carboxylesterase